MVGAKVGIACSLFVLCGILAACVAPTPAPDLSSFFDGYQGCFVMWDVSADEYVYHNPSRCTERLSPCSTYKIPHSLIGLETGVIPDQHHIIAWDGTKYPVEVWNQDHTMASAVQNSVVWYFQAVAEGIGGDRMQAYLGEFGYGNEDISGGLTEFWLGSSLAISADEQIDFLDRLRLGSLSVSSRSMDVVKEVILLDEGDGYAYRGKTGSCVSEGEQPLGWFVGYVERDDTTYIFATNIQAAEASGQRAQSITEGILIHLNLIP